MDASAGNPLFRGVAKKVSFTDNNGPCPVGANTREFHEHAAYPDVPNEYHGR